MTVSESDRLRRVPRTVLCLGCLVLSGVAAGCGGGDDESAGSAADVDCRVDPDTAVAMYVGWAISRRFGDRDASEDARVPAEIKADVETFARALVKYSATYADEDLGSPPEALGIELGAAPTDNDLERFWYAVDSMDREERTLERLDAWALENCPPPYP